MSAVDEWARRHRAKREEKRAEKASRRGLATVAMRPSMRPAPEIDRPFAPLDLSNDLVFVSVPCWRTPPALLERAVRSVLAGEHAHVRVVVVSDGEETPSWSSLPDEVRADSRLCCVASTKNTGPYFLHDVVMRVAAELGAPLFAVQDSDDVSAPSRLRRLVDAMHRHRFESVHAQICQIGDGHRRILKGSAQAGPLWAHRVDHFGMYGVATLQALGGYHAGFRVGYDTNLTSFLNLFTRAAVAPDILYTRHLRASSLTRASQTGHGSALRREHKIALRAMWEETYRRSRTSRGEAAKYVRELAISRSHKSGLTSLRRELVAEVTAKIAAARPEVPPVHEALLGRVAADEDGKRLYRTCEAKRPEAILQVGAGATTSALSLYAARHGKKLVMVEPDHLRRDEVAAELSRIGLRRHIEIVRALEDVGVIFFDVMVVSAGAQRPDASQVHLSPGAVVGRAEPQP